MGKKKRSELEKLDAGLEYDFWDQEVHARKLRAIELCGRLNALDQADEKARLEVIGELFGSAGENTSILNGFNCDYGLNIHAGKKFLCNYNVTILDIAPVTIGDYVMVGPNTLISTVNHPISTKGRRRHLGIGKPVSIGNDVWIGGNVTILPSVHIGNNVIVAAGAVVTKDIPDNCIAGGVPAKIIREIVNDLAEEEQE